MNVFVYGSLKKNHYNHLLLAGCEFVQKATTKPLYRLYDCGRYPCMVKDDKGVSVHGEIYKVDAAVLASLDRLEGVPFLYQREEVELLDFSDPVFGYLYQRDVSRFTDCGNEWNGCKN